MTVPAPEFRVRPATMDDLDAVLALVVAHDIAEFGHPDFSLENLRGEWEELDLAEDSFLAVAPDGQVVGYATVRHRRNYVQIDSDGYVHPDHWGLGVGALLVRVTEERARRLAPLAPEGIKVVLTNAVSGANRPARALLEQEGYQATRHFWRMVIDLEGPPAPVSWPEGITVRPCASEADERSVFLATDEAFRDHWGYVPETYDEWRPCQKDASDTSLWFLVEEDGEPTAAAVCTYFMDMGWVRRIGVRRPWRRRGLGEALLRHAFREFYRRGTTCIGLGVDASNPTGATRLYEKADMRVVHEYALYQKVLRPGRDPGPEPEE